MYRIRVTYHKDICMFLYAVIQVIEHDPGLPNDIFSVYDTSKNHTVHKNTLTTTAFRYQDDCLVSVNTIIEEAKQEISRLRRELKESEKEIPDERIIEI